MHVDSFESVAIDDVLVLVEADMRSNDAATSCSLDVCWGNMEVVVIAESSLQGSVLDFLVCVDCEAFSPHLLRDFLTFTLFEVPSAGRGYGLRSLGLPSTKC
jgi:hypothetical protein